MSTSAPEEPRRTSRRGTLARAAALGAAALAARAAMSGQASAANGDTIKVGGAVTGTQLTELGGDFAGPVLEVYNQSPAFVSEDGAIALMGLVQTPFPDPTTATAIFGRNGRENSTGIYGEASGDRSTGIHAVANASTSTALQAFSTGGNGISVKAGQDGLTVEAGRVGINVSGSSQDGVRVPNP
jgi:hypothetical protein